MARPRRGVPAAARPWQAGRRRRRRRSSRGESRRRGRRRSSRSGGHRTRQSAGAVRTRSLCCPSGRAAGPPRRAAPRARARTSWPGGSTASRAPARAAPPRSSPWRGTLLTGRRGRSSRSPQPPRRRARRAPARVGRSCVGLRFDACVRGRGGERAPACRPEAESRRRIGARSCAWHRRAPGSTIPAGSCTAAGCAGGRRA